MRTNFINYSLLVSFIILSLLIFPSSIVQSKPLAQNSELIQATGPICALDTGECGTFSFTFPPLGGPVNGSYQLTFTRVTSTGSYTYHENGTLKGTFSGGDGGSINGTFTSVIRQGANTDNYGGSWEGQVNANGTANGTISAKGLSNTWETSFSADEFLSKSNNNISSQESTTETAEPTISPTPTSFEVVGMKIDIYPKAKEFINSSPSIDEATKKIFNQDSILIVRDINNNYYAVTNQKKAIPIPAELSGTFQLSNQFAILGNEGIISKTGHKSISNNINGGNNSNQQERTPADLKEKDYMLLETNCSTNPKQSDNPKIQLPRLGKLLSPPAQYDTPIPECRSSVVQNELGSSFRIGGKALYGEDTYVGSSEHSSVRGTINGGGDFINLPNSIILASYTQSFKSQPQLSTTPAYLGVLVQDKSNGAEVILVQANSPAEISGIEPGDIISTVSGKTINIEQPLVSIINQYHGGDEVQLVVTRNNQNFSADLVLAKLLPPIIHTPTAEITVSDKSDLVVDIGLNGVTGILILADSVNIREPVTGSEVVVSAGQALIVVPGEPVGEPFVVTDQDLNSWWKNPSLPDTASSKSNTSSTSYNASQAAIQVKDFNPIPGIDGTVIYWGGWFLFAIVYLFIFIIRLFRKS